MRANSISIDFDPAALDYVFRMLTRCPFSEVQALIADIQKQVAEQQTPPLPIIEKAEGD